MVIISFKSKSTYSVYNTFVLFSIFHIYIGVTESENALSFAELALVFNKIFSLGPIFHGILVPRIKSFAEIGPKLKSWSYSGPIFQGTKIFVPVQTAQ